jgi:hypothetical protein
MRNYIYGCIAIGVMTALPLLSQTKTSDNGAGPLAHVRNGFDLTVHAPYNVAAPLFGPNGERAWGEGHWDPQFLYPQPANDVEGAVFTVQHGGLKSVWVNTVFDTAARHFQYVYFVPDAMVTTIDVNFLPVDDANTKVHVVYTRTALDAAANDHVRMLGEHDRASGVHWQTAIDAYLRGGKR